MSATIASGTNVTVSGNETTTAPDLFVNGTLQITSTAATPISATGTIYMNAGGTYLHNRDGGPIPTAIWNPASTCNISGIGVTNPTGAMAAATTWGNFIWSSVGTVGAFGANMTIAGNFRSLQVC